MLHLYKQKLSTVQYFLSLKCFLFYFLNGWIYPNDVTVISNTASAVEITTVTDSTSNLFWFYAIPLNGHNTGIARWDRSTPWTDILIMSRYTKGL